MCGLVCVNFLFMPTIRLSVIVVKPTDDNTVY